jgi:hypothetical protein
MQREPAKAWRASSAAPAIGAFIAAYALLGDNIVGVVIIVLAASGMVQPLILWALAVVIVGLINLACCYWIVREWSAFRGGAGGRLERRIDGLRDSRLMRRPIAWISEGNPGRFALAAILTNAITAVAAARVVGAPVDGRRIMYASFAFAAVSCALHTAFGSIIGNLIRSVS